MSSITCFCSEEAELEFDGGWLYRCYSCGLEGRVTFSPKAAKKSFRILLAKMEDDE